jgi:hypothetical protein
VSINSSSSCSVLLLYDVLGLDVMPCLWVLHRNVNK